VKIKFDPAKREKTLLERGLDFGRCAEICTGPVLEMEDDRFDCGEKRTIIFGLLDARMLVVAWTPRGDVRRIISMRKANEREHARFEKYLG